MSENHRLNDEHFMEMEQCTKEVDRNEYDTKCNRYVLWALCEGN